MYKSRDTSLYSLHPNQFIQQTTITWIAVELMASRTLQNVLFVALTTTILCGGALAQSSSNSCTSALVSLSPCLNYIAGNESAPSSSCCSQLANVVQSEPQCLCVAVNGGASSASSLGINVNQTQALALPGACKVQTPPISQCQGKYNLSSSSTYLVIFLSFLCKSKSV